MIVINRATYGNRTHRKIGVAGSRWLGGTIVTVFYVFVVCCVLLCVQEVVGSWVSAVGSYSKYNILYYGFVLGVGISIIVIDTYAILVKYLAWENGGREKNDKSVVRVVCCKNCYLLLLSILPMANMRRTYEEIGLCVDN
jgi:hypothetical protein